MKHNKEFIRGALLGALTVLLIFGVVSCGVGTSGIRYLFNRRSASEDAEESRKITDKDVETKMELLETLIDNYYMGEIDRKELEEGLYKGYINGLEDPYSVYYDAEETKEMTEATTGEYSGVGAVMTQNPETGVITILQVYEGSPAEEAGVQAQDILYKVEDREVTGADLGEVVSDIKGEEGTEVELTLIRGEEAEEVTVTAVRRKIEAQTVTWEMKDDAIGYIRVTEFDTVTCDQYKNALAELEKQGMKGLVVDLRSNPGGNLDTVVDMLDLMLPEGTVVSMKDKQGKTTEYDSDEEHQFQKPLAVLVNGYSASASEIYAGAVQDFQAGQIVGTQSFGKGVVQQIYDLRDGTSVKLTIAEYFVGEDVRINGKGVTPDVEVEYQPDEENPSHDNQLEKALEVIREQL